MNSLVKSETLNSYEYVPKENSDESNTGCMHAYNYINYLLAIVHHKFIYLYVKYGNKIGHKSGSKRPIPMTTASAMLANVLFA